VGIAAIVVSRSFSRYSSTYPFSSSMVCTFDSSASHQRNFYSSRPAYEVRFLQLNFNAVECSERELHEY
jgi:hypothetical protein